MVVIVYCYFWLKSNCSDAKNKFQYFIGLLVSIRQCVDKGYIFVCVCVLFVCVAGIPHRGVIAHFALTNYFIFRKQKRSATLVTAN